MNEAKRRGLSWFLPENPDVLGMLGAPGGR